jgi:hypothetical protein
MSLRDHTMQDREPPFRLACEFSKEIAERINNMSLMELRKIIQNAGTERGSLHVCKPNASMPSVDSIANNAIRFWIFATLNRVLIVRATMYSPSDTTFRSFSSSSHVACPLR